MSSSNSMGNFDLNIINFRKPISSSRVITPEVLTSSVTSNSDLELECNPTGKLILTGTQLISPNSGGNSGQHLVVTINGTQYKIRLELN